MKYVNFENSSGNYFLVKTEIKIDEIHGWIYHFGKEIYEEGRKVYLHIPSKQWEELDHPYICYLMQ